MQNKLKTWAGVNISKQAIKIILTKISKQAINNKGWGFKIIFLFKQIYQ